MPKINLFNGNYKMKYEVFMKVCNCKLTGIILKPVAFECFSIIDGHLNALLEVLLFSRQRRRAQIPLGHIS